MKKLVIILLILGFNPGSEAQSFRALQALNPKVEQGGVLIFKIAPQFMPPATSNPALFIQEWKKSFYPNVKGEVFIGIDINEKPGKYIFEYHSNGQRYGWDYEEIEIIAKNFPSRTRDPFTPSAKWRKERNVIESAYLNGHFNEKHFDGEFIRPLDLVVIDKNRTIGDITARGFFGPGHEGVDLITLNPQNRKHQRPVKAINSGRIALIARNFSTDGNMIIIDHGSGIFSIYMHLSGFRVNKVGDDVKTGDIIGISGDTGSAKRGGPHLHFAVKVKRADHFVYIDPLAFIETMNQYLTK